MTHEYVKFIIRQIKEIKISNIIKTIHISSYKNRNSIKQGQDAYRNSPTSTFSLFFFTLFFSLFLIPCSLYAKDIELVQEKKEVLNTHNSIIINPQFHVFSNNEAYRDGSFSPVNPGIEIVYQRKLNTIFSVSSGLSYIYSSWNHSIGIKSHFKRISHELFIPLLFESRLKDNFLLSCGIYPGWLIAGKELYRNNVDIRRWRDNTNTTHYNSSPKYTMDLFIGAGILNTINEKHYLNFTPFIKYKLTDSWMGEIRNRLTFGIKLNVPINF